MGVGCRESVSTSSGIYGSGWRCLAVATKVLCLGFQVSFRMVRGCMRSHGTKFLRDRVLAVEVRRGREVDALASGRSDRHIDAMLFCVVGTV